MPDVDLETLIQGIKDRNRRMIAKTMTLIESRVPAHQQMAARIMEQILPLSGNSIRLGSRACPGWAKAPLLKT
jgi:LAO/AO transport system kinase